MPQLTPARRPAVLLTLALLFAGADSRAQPSPLDGPLSPVDAPRSFRLAPGLRVELVAAEPMVVSPVAVAFDEQGALFVAENRGYPTGPPPGSPPVGRIAQLEDTDGDGRMDRRTEFAEGLSYPNGVLPWKGGLIVTCAPDVLYLRDTDGDGKADDRTVLFTGFSTKGSTQLRVSHPTLGPDGWVYLTSGLTGGQVTNPAHPEKPAVVLGRTDFRFLPDGTAWEAADGGSQFGMTFDEAGHRFICYNRVQVQHVVLASKDLRRNPNLAFSDTVQNCPADMVAEPLKGHGAAARLYPVSRNVTTADSHAGTFTAACAVTVWKGTHLPDLYRGAALSCDPTGNLVHADLLHRRGATFEAVSAHPGTELLASTDNWFRPVFLAHGPDGALYVVDMYRKTIEHPDYLPVEVRKRTDFSGGKDRGRIWRVVREDETAESLRGWRGISLAPAFTRELVRQLRSEDGFTRETAQRLLLGRRDPTAVGPLRDLAADPKAPAAAAVLALGLLDYYGELDRLLPVALDHPAPAVRETALRFAEARVRSDAAIAARIVQRADDPAPRVRFQLALTLGAAPLDPGHTGDDGVAAALARVAWRDGGDRWSRAAVFSSVAGRERAFLRSLGSNGRPQTLAADLLRELGRLLGAGRPRGDWAAVVRELVDGSNGFRAEEQVLLLGGFAESVRGRLAPGEADDLFAAVLGTGSDHAEVARRIRERIDEAASTAADTHAAADRRQSAVALLAYAPPEVATRALLPLVGPDQPAELRAAAVRALGTRREPQVAAELLGPGRFATYPPAVREEVLAALTGSTAHVPGLLAAIEQGRLPVGAVDALRRRQLTQSRDPEVRKRAEALFGGVTGDRAKVFDDYKAVVDLKADADHGRVVFRRECANCHRLDQEGHAVGPDLFGIRNQPKPAILLHILVPDQEITQGFASYTVATRDGRVLTGLIVSETPTSLTLRQPLGKEDTILRSDVEELAAGSQSLMPQGLEKNISRQEFADLLSYLKGEGPSAAAGSR